MPRNYVRKREPPKYTTDDIRHAVEDVVSKKRTYRDASDYYGIPISVIYHRIKGRNVSLERIGAGTSKAFSDKIENYIVQCVIARSRLGYPCQKEELKELVGDYVSRHELKTPFVNYKPGDDWYYNFMKRHPELSLKKPELLQKARIDARKPQVVYHFYDLLSTTITENNLFGKPHYVFNTDESGFLHDPNKVRGIGVKGVALSRISGGSGRESTTVLGCVSAYGNTLPPLIIFKGAAVQARWTSEKAYAGTLYGVSKNGWMEEANYFQWLTTGFIPFVNNVRESNNEPNHPVLLICDGHASHYSVRIIEEATKANIILLKFPSHLTDRIQPLDKCVFGPVKKMWDKALVAHGMKQMGKGSGHLTKEKFSELLGEVWCKALCSKNIISGFHTTGIFPADASKFQEKLFKTEELQIYKNIINGVSGFTEFNKNAPVPCGSRERQSVEQVVLQASGRNDQTLLASDDCQSNKQTALVSNDYQLEEPNAFDSNGQQSNEPVILVSNYCQLGEPNTFDSNGQQVALISNECQSNEFVASGSKKQQLNEPVSLIHSIIKLISLDTKTDDAVKTKIINAIACCDTTEENMGDEFKSPNMKCLQKIFCVQDKTPTKIKKIVIPRLKQAAYGEVLTSEQVKTRLLEAEEKKKKQNKKIPKAKTQEKTKAPNDKGMKRKMSEGSDDAKKNKNKKMKKEDTSGKIEERVRAKKRNSRSDSELSDTDVTYGESGDSEYDPDDEVSEDFLELKAPNVVRKGNFVLVRYKGGKRLTTVYKYVSVVQDIDDEDLSEVKVTSLKCMNNTKKCFILKENDISFVNIEDIIGVLPEPILSLQGERIYYKFDKPVDVFEKA